jgi:hypothetical protein
MTVRPVSQAEVDAAVAELVGLTFNGSSRAVDMEMFHFGAQGTRVDTKSRVRMTGGLALHVQSGWRIVEGDRIVVGYDDWRDPPDGVELEGWDPSEARKNRRDELIEAWFLDRVSPRIVVGAAAHPSGDLQIDLDDETALEIVPVSTLDDDELWRIFVPNGPHVVVQGARAYWTGD